MIRVRIPLSAPNSNGVTMYHHLFSKDKAIKAYAGIGARKTPSDILIMMTDIAKALDSRGYVLFSGGADGADKAFESGATQKIIFIPWNGFNGYSPTPDIVSLSGAQNQIYEEAVRLAKDNHPYGQNLKSSVLRLMARNVFQVLGPSLKSPIKFLICWTPDGCESHITRTLATGSTGCAISLASKLNIPIFNLANEKSFSRLKRFLETAKTHIYLQLR